MLQNGYPHWTHSAWSELHRLQHLVVSRFSLGRTRVGDDHHSAGSCLLRYCVNHSGEDIGMKVAPSRQQTNWIGSFDQTNAAVLQQAVEKLVRFGQQVGVTADDMIS